LLEKALSAPVLALFYGLRSTGHEGIVPRVSLVHSGAILVDLFNVPCMPALRCRSCQLGVGVPNRSNLIDVSVPFRSGDLGEKSRASLITPLHLAKISRLANYQYPRYNRTFEMLQMLFS
jgi:hypothetical protein